MKKYLLILIIVAAGSSYAQQISLNSQYLFNEMLVNPGAIGIKGYIPIQLSFRKQSVNFPGSPTTQYLSSQSYLNENNAIGGTIFNDVAGPSRRTGLNFNYSYKLRLDAQKKHMIGLGLGVSLNQHVIDVNSLITYLPDDKAIVDGYNYEVVPDANFGAFYRYKNKGFAGLSVFNLFELNRDLYDFQNPIQNPMATTFYFIGGYEFELSKTFDLKTTTLVQAIKTGTNIFDITALGIFKKFVWAGVSYRHTDAVVFMAGGQAGPFRFGYSYDYTLSDIGNYSFGSHEIFLEIQIFKKENRAKTPWLKRNRIFSPNL